MNAVLINIKKGSLLVSIILIYFSNYTRAINKDSLLLVRWQKAAEFRGDYPGIELHTNPVTGVPEYLYGDISKNQTKSDPVDAAFQFLEQNGDLYGISNPREELSVKGVAKDQYGALVDLKQVYKGIEVYEAGMGVHFTSAGKLKGITGGFVQIPSLSTTPSIDSFAATKIAKTDLNYTAEEEKRVTELAFLRRRSIRPVKASKYIASYQGNFYLVWIVGIYRVLPIDAESWEYWIDAHARTILQKKETLSSMHRGRDRKRNESKVSQPKLK